MNKLKYLLSLAIVFIVLPNIIYADCTVEERKHFKEIEDEYKVTYEFNKDTETYSATFYSPEPDNYDYMLFDNVFITNCKTISDSEVKCENLPGKTYYMQITGRSSTCNDVLKETYLNFSKKNSYWDDPLCEGIEEFVLCQPTYDKEIDYDTFVSRVNTYKKTKQREVAKEDNEKKQNSILNKTFDFIKENIFQLIVGIIFIIVIIVTIILTAKSIRKRRRLE